MKASRHSWSYLTHFFLQWEVFQTKVLEKIKTHILCSVLFFPENRAVYEVMWKNIVEPCRPQMSIWHKRIACWIPKTTYTHTLRICNTYRFSTATVVTRNLLHVTLYVLWRLVLITVQRDATQISLFTRIILQVPFYMFRVSTTPIIKSTQNCNYSLRYCSYFCAATSLQRDQAWARWREVAAQYRRL